MRKQSKQLLLLIIILPFLMAVTKPVHAIPPPDFVFTVGSQIIQIFSLVFIFASAIFFSIFQLIKVYFKRFKASKYFWIAVVLVLAALSLLIAYSIDQYRQNQAYIDAIES